MENTNQVETNVATLDNAAKPETKPEQSEEVKSNAEWLKMSEMGKKAAKDFLSADIKHGQTKRKIVLNAAKVIGADADKLDAFLTGYQLQLVELKYKDGSIAVLKSNLKTVLTACHKIGAETIETLPGEWNDFVAECRNRLAVLNPANPPETSKKNQGGNTTNNSRKVSEKEVDSVADKAQRMSVAQNHQVIQANIKAMAEKPNFEVGMMQNIHASLLELAEKSQDDFWRKNAESLLETVSKILADSKAAAEAAAKATNAAKEDSKESTATAE